MIAGVQVTYENGEIFVHIVSPSVELLRTLAFEAGHTADRIINGLNLKAAPTGETGTDQASSVPGSTAAAAGVSGDQASSVPAAAAGTATAETPASAGNASPAADIAPAPAAVVDGTGPGATAVPADAAAAS